MYYTSLLTYKFMVQHAAFTIGFEFFYHTVQSKGTAEWRQKYQKSVLNFCDTLNWQLATRTHFGCIVVPVCQTDNLQMLAPTSRGYRAKECRSSARAAWEQRDASWLWLPLGFKDTLTCVWAHTHTGTNTRTHMFVHYFGTFVQTSSRVCAQVWLNTIQMQILYSHSNTNTHAHEHAHTCTRRLMFSISLLLCCHSVSSTSLVDRIGTDKKLKVVDGWLPACATTWALVESIHAYSSKS